MIDFFSSWWHRADAGTLGPIGGDIRSSLAVANELHASIPHSKLAVMPGLGHECYLESAEAFDREVRSFLLSLEV